MTRHVFPTLGAALLVAAGAFANETVRIKGSDTIGGRLSPELAEAYRASHPGVSIPIEALGSSTAFVGLFDGTAEIGQSSRPISDKELSRAKDLGLELHETVIGYDGVAVVVNPTNPIASLSIAQLADLFTGKVANWRELGGADLAVRLISRPSYSGTHAFFKERVVRRGNAKGPEEFAPTTEFIEENGAIVAAVAGDPRAVSYIGLGWLEGQVKALAVTAQTGESPVEPAIENVRSGRYPLYRPLLMYVRADAPQSAREFLAFVLSESGAMIVRRNGFVPPDRTGAMPAFLSGTAAAPRLAAGRGSMTRVTFAFNAFTPSAASLDGLTAVAAKLKTGGYRAVVVGHADGRGPAEVNRRIALLRAQSVANELVRLGANRALMRVESSGAEAPVASNESAAGRAENRRVDIEVIPVRP
jgi:phosphate binding protein